MENVKPIGQIREGPFVMRLPNVPTRREPDIMVILNTNLHLLTPTYVDVPADICIEVVSPDSVDRDRGKKFRQYESGGVPEYWIIDPLHVESLFYRRNDGGVYVPYVPDVEGNYRTPNLLGLVLHVLTLFKQPLPSFQEIGDAVRAMVASQ